jgi:hypothetical protein
MPENVHRDRFETLFIRPGHSFLLTRSSKQPRVWRDDAPTDGLGFGIDRAVCVAVRGLPRSHVR